MICLFGKWGQCASGDEEALGLGFASRKEAVGRRREKKSETVTAKGNLRVAARRTY